MVWLLRQMLRTLGSIWPGSVSITLKTVRNAGTVRGVTRTMKRIAPGCVTSLPFAVPFD
jgi:hypothetical protein